MDGFNFGASLESFLAALFGFLNDLLNGVFGWLAMFFGGINVDIN